MTSKDLIRELINGAGEAVPTPEIDPLCLKKLSATEIQGLRHQGLEPSEYVAVQAVCLNLNGKGTPFKIERSNGDRVGGFVFGADFPLPYKVSGLQLLGSDGQPAFQNIKDIFPMSTPPMVRLVMKREAIHDGLTGYEEE